MTDTFKFFAANSTAAIIIAIAILLLAVCLVVICIVAFVQGRSISFWPPSIGQKPVLAEKPAQPETVKPEPISSQTQVLPTPVVGVGTMLEAASTAQYKVTSAFYRGSTSTIYKALDPTGQHVIAKVFWDSLAQNSVPWQLFQSEQRAADILNHRNIIKSIDRGIRQGFPFTIMEYLVGGTLRDWFLSHHRLPIRDVLSIASQIAEAIDYAHSMGVIHRDVKPGNILFEAGPQDRIVLCDFGVALLLADAQTNNTAVGTLRGSPAYLAPEILRGNVPTRSVDIYSFGSVLFEMIANTVPFRNIQPVYALLHAKLESPAPDIRTFRPEVPVEVAERLALTLSRDPGLRPRSAKAVLAGLDGPLHQLEM